MELTYVGKDPGSGNDNCPALYRTDRDSYIVQGWRVTDPAALAELAIPDHETCVEIPARMLPLFRPVGG
ncbi:hypothetical protein [Pilimelia anulata]|uniref:hypothetical protein n=1 Tax=Pilimelia anulata TaxID=53371 RepID=UPI00166647FC|nr:hypothetical protein [Pilimelia anulata]